MVKISISDKRNPNPSSILLENGVVLTTWGAIKVNRVDFLPSSFQIRTGSLIIYVDPIEVDSSDKADFILITHQHPDHLSMRDIYKLKKPETKIISPEGAVKKLKRIGEEIVTIRPGEKMKFNELLLEAVPAYNMKPLFLWIKAHPKRKGNVGYILTLGETLKVYHTGDKDLIPEMDEISDIDLLLVPIGGDNMTMNEEEASLITGKIRPGKVIPMHYDISKEKKRARFKESIDESIKMIEL